MLCRGRDLLLSDGSGAVMLHVSKEGLDCGWQMLTSALRCIDCTSRLRVAFAGDLALSRGQTPHKKAREVQKANPLYALALVYALGRKFMGHAILGIAVADICIAPCLPHW